MTRPKTARPEADLASECLQFACEAVRHSGDEKPLRAVSLGAPDVEWSPGHLRTVRDERVGVYHKHGALNVVLDGRGRLLELNDARHVPVEAGIRMSANDAIERVAVLCGLPREQPMLRAEFALHEGIRFLHVTTIPPASRIGPGGLAEVPQHPEVEAWVNGWTGGIWKLTHAPALRERRRVKAKTRAPTEDAS